VLKEINIYLIELFIYTTSFERNHEKLLGHHLRKYFKKVKKGLYLFLCGAILKLEIFIFPPG